MSSTAKTLWAPVVAVATVIAVFCAACLAVVIAVYSYFMNIEAAENRSCDSGSGTQQALDPDGPKGLTVKGVVMSDAQWRNAVTIVSEATKNGLSALTAGKIALMTAIQESSLINVPYGDRDSAGLFQQRRPWGTYRQRMNPHVSAYMFFFGGRNGYSEPGLTDVPDWENMAPGDAAQAVQVSAFPGAYAEHESEAEAIVKAIVGDSGDVEMVAYSDDCNEVDRIEAAVRAALSRENDDYEWGDQNGSGLVSWAFSQADITLPDDLSGLLDYKGNAAEGVEAKLLSAQEITSSESLRRGDLVFWSTDDDSDPERVGVEPGGEGAVSDFRIATYNVLGSNHTSAESAAQRIKTSAALIEEENIGVVGLQELRPDQRRDLLDLLGYDIFPKKPNYGRGAVSVNSIIWDPTRYELTENGGELVPMRFYFGRTPTEIPRVKLRDLVSGQEFYVTNTHDPAHPEYAELRYLNALEHERQMDALTSEGLPMFFTGDFNSGFNVRPKGNTTYHGDRDNLTWCVMTRSGTMRNAYDVYENRSGTCPQQTSNEPGDGTIDHVYVSSDVRVDAYEHITSRDRTASDHGVVVVDAEFGTATDTVGEKKWSSTAVAYADGTVRISTFDTREVVGVLRLTASEASETGISVVAGEWTAPMRKGTYSLPSSDAGRYGWRIHPIRGTSDFHNGIDLGAGTGTPVYSIGAGTVVKATYDSCWGNLVIVDHGEYLSMYTHLNSFALPVIPNMPVVAGQRLGEVGDTGACSAGSHLHFTVGTSLDILRGEEAGSVDPGLFLRAQGIVL